MPETIWLREASSPCWLPFRRVVKKAPCVVFTVLAVVSCVVSDASGKDGTVTSSTESSYAMPSVNVYGVVETPPVVPVTTRLGTQFNAVSEEQIARQGALDFYDALKNVPGVTFRKQNIVGGQTGPSLYVRGRGASHPSPDMTVLFDDVPRSGVLYGQSLADGIPVYALGGMEIHKYPQPSRFGSGYAMLNFVPKFMTEEGTEVRIGAQGGSYGTFAQNVAAGARKGRADIYFAQSMIVTDGHVSHSSAGQKSVYINAGYRLTDEWTLRLMGNYVDAETDAPTNPLTGNWDGTFSTARRYETESSLVTLALSHDYGSVSGTVKAYYNNTNFTLLGEASQKGGIYVPDTGDSKQSNDLFGLRLRETLRPWSGGEIVAGLDLDRMDLKNRKKYHDGSGTTWNFPDVTRFSPYVAVSHTFGTADAWHATPSVGIRWHQDSVFADKGSPHGGLVAGYDGTDLHANVARGVNYPSPVILQGFLGDGALPSTLDLGDVKPEVVDHYEVGLTHVWDGGSVGVTAFYDKGRDRLRVNMGWPKFPAYAWAFTSSVSRYRVRGLELTGSLSPIDDLDLFLGLTWLRAHAVGDDGVERDRMPYTPKFSLQVGASWNMTDKILLHVDYQYQHDVYCDTSTRTAAGTLEQGFAELDARYRLPDQNLLNLKLEYLFEYSPWCIKDGKVFVSVFNLFGRKQAGALEVRGDATGYYYMPGRTVMAGFEMRF